MFPQQKNNYSKTAEFVSFCIEEYAKQKNISGARVIEIFEAGGAIDYLFENYEALHTQGFGYIIPAIESQIKERTKQ